MPIVEDETVSLSHELQSDWPNVGENETITRGEIDQIPVILDASDAKSILIEPSKVNERVKSGVIAASTSSEDFQTSSGSEDSNQDRRYIFIPEKGIEIPLTYDEPRTPKYGKKQHTHSQNSPRHGGQGISNLRTDIAESIPPKQESLRLDRAPSPYACNPSPRKSNDSQFDGEVLAPSEVLSPMISSGKSESISSANRFRSSRRHERKASSPTSEFDKPLGPVFNRHASASVVPGEHMAQKLDGDITSPTPYPLSSDDSDLSPDELWKSRSRRKLRQQAPGSSHKTPMPRSEDFSNELQRKKSLFQQPVSSPIRAASMFNINASLKHGYVATGAGSHNMNVSTFGPPSERLQQSSPTTPYSSPPATPGEEAIQKAKYTAGSRNTPSSSRPRSRTTSPTQPLESSYISYSKPNTRNHHRDARTVATPISQVPTPLSSPAIEGTSYISAPRIDVREPSPSSKVNQPSNNTTEVQHQSSRYVYFNSATLPHPPRLQPPPVPGHRRTLSNVETMRTPAMEISTPQQFTQLPLSPYMDSRPLKSRNAAFIESPPVELPPCSRPYPVAGLTDWYTLSGYPSFAICPSCREGVSRAGFAKYFTPVISKALGQYTRCSFSTPWLRMAWLLTLTERRSDAKLIHAMAQVAAQEPPCPGKTPSVRQWYRVVDSERGRQISGFDICSCCVRNLEIIFPILHSCFEISRSHRRGKKRTCMLRSESKRFPAFIDQLEAIAKQANESKKHPNPTPFIELAEESPTICECSADDMLLDQVWHTIPQIPELTVCEECFDEVIQPAASSSFLASLFSAHPKHVAPTNVGISCQLYSPRMRNVFTEACQRNDLAWLRSVAAKRYRIERDLQARRKDLQTLRMGEEERARKIEALVNEWEKWE